MSAKKSRLRHQRRIAETVHSAMLQRLEPLGLQPELADDAALEVFVRVFEDRATLSVNTSGEHLHRRGYRLDVTTAPIRETLAAGVLLMAGLAAPSEHVGGAGRYDLLIDPVCGSGTFLIEAAMLTGGLAPGRARSFAFEHLPYFQASKWERFRREADAAARPARVRIIGADIDREALAAARANAERAGVLGDLALLQADARTLAYHRLSPGAARPLLVANLPYGRRLGSEVEAKQLSAAFCRRLRACCDGWEAALVTAHPQWFRDAGCSFGRSLQFSNGGLLTSLLLGVLA